MTARRAVRTPAAKEDHMSTRKKEAEVKTAPKPKTTTGGTGRSGGVAAKASRTASAVTTSTTRAAGANSSSGAHATKAAKKPEAKSAAKTAPAKTAPAKPKTASGRAAPSAVDPPGSATPTAKVAAEVKSKAAPRTDGAAKPKAPAKADTAKDEGTKADGAKADGAKAEGTKADGTRAKAPAKPKADPYAGDLKFLAEQRALLESERGIYQGQAVDLKAEADSLAQEREPGDVQFDEESGEGGTVTVDRERDLALSAQALLAVEEIDEALARIDAGTYGVCERCHQAIPKPRLRALPYARLCVACKSGGLSRR
jgi:DnaK suppressor protein